MPNTNLKYLESVRYLESIFNIPQPARKNSRVLFLKRLKYFLNLLGNPQDGINYIHVGGTSGKGSVATMIHSIFTQAKINAGLYTSPHITTTIERIKVGDKFIAPKDFIDILEELKPTIDQVYQESGFGRLSYYEILAAISFIYFKKKKCDWVILEVGLGGLHDATNVIPPAKITIINQIGLDHTKVLGNTITEIAKTKAGIIKPKTIFFTTQSNSKTVLDIFIKACKRQKAEFNRVKTKNKNYSINLFGEKQKENAVLAAAVCQKIGLKENDIKAGLLKTKLPCRFEIIQKNPLIILDGAHNISKIKTVVENLPNLTYKRLYLIIALTSERNGGRIFKDLIPFADKIFITRYLTSRKKCLPPLKLKVQLKTKKPIQILIDPQMALNQAKKIAKPDDLIIITGSFYLAGELRKNWISQEKILSTRKS